MSDEAAYEAARNFTEFALRLVRLDYRAAVDRLTAVPLELAAHRVASARYVLKDIGTRSVP